MCCLASGTETRTTGIAVAAATAALRRRSLDLPGGDSGPLVVVCQAGARLGLDLPGGDGGPLVVVRQTGPHQGLVEEEEQDEGEDEGQDEGEDTDSAATAAAAAKAAEEHVDVKAQSQSFFLSMF